MREWEKHTTCCDAPDVQESVALTGLLHSVVNWYSPNHSGEERARDGSPETERSREGTGRVQGKLQAHMEDFHV